MPHETIERLCLIASELGMNLVRHSVGGELWVTPLERAGCFGIEIRVEDRGPGISEPDRAFLGERTSKRGLGIGLAGVASQAEEFDVEVRMGEATRIRARLFAAPCGRVPEYALVGRPHPEEVVSGDHGFVVRDGGRMLVGLVDGLGHGLLARRAADAAVEAARSHLDEGLDSMMSRVDGALRKGRGAVMALVRVDPRRSQLTYAVSGNIRVLLAARREVHELRGSTHVLGTAAGAPPRGSSPRIGSRPVVRTLEWRHGSVLIAHTDGISSRAQLDHPAQLARQHPVVTAGRLVTAHARSHDDALVAVVR